MTAKKKQPAAVELTPEQKRLRTNPAVFTGKMPKKWLTRHGTYAKYCRAAKWDVETGRRAYINEPWYPGWREAFLVRFGIAPTTLSRCIMRFGWGKQRDETQEKIRLLNALMEKADDEQDVKEIKRLNFLAHNRILSMARARLEAQITNSTSSKELFDSLRAYELLNKLTGDATGKDEAKLQAEIVADSGSAPGPDSLDELSEEDRLEQIMAELGPSGEQLPPGYTRDLLAEQNSRKATRNGQIQTVEDEHALRWVERDKEQQRELGVG